MRHLTETQLNEYLDGLLEASAQVQISAHLSHCADCRAKLDSLQAVFQALAGWVEETPERNLTPAVLDRLPRRGSGLAGRLVWALQAGLGIGLLLLFAPILMDRVSGILQGWIGRLALPEVRLPARIDFQFSIPIFQPPHPPTLIIPLAILHANLPVWLALGIAAFLLFTFGNFSLIFHASPRIKK